MADTYIYINIICVAGYLYMYITNCQRSKENSLQKLYTPSYCIFRRFEYNSRWLSDSTARAAGQGMTAKKKQNDKIERKEKHEKAAGQHG